MTLRLRPDKIGSVCTPFEFGPYIKVRPQPHCAEGAAVAVRVLTSRDDYGHLELPSGRMSKLVPGDVIVGVLGNRAALRGFAGRIPSKLNADEELHLLNVGGVLGVSEGRAVGLGEPIRLQVLGAPILADRPALLSDFALPVPAPYQNGTKIIGVVGTCMNSGKSTAASVLIRSLRARGLRVHAGKATGVGAIKDILSFRDNGAALGLSFLDCGVPSTAFRNDVPEIYKSLISHLAEEAPDVIVIELGDGLFGEYGVDEIIAGNPGFATTIVAANDVIGGWAAVQRLQSHNIPVSVVTGPATDNLAAVAKFQSLKIPAANIMREPQQFTDYVLGDIS
ncbi:hypothetical protein QPK87_06760 [Kamptonema cortianum]|nr:hypothetical protein [Geitlerinema splendidum]MDK3156273.1 hypothetical protein [Kamptonema cortianum]